MNEIIVDKINYNLPSDFKELTEDQGNKIALILFSRAISEDQKRVLILIHLMGIKEAVFNKIPSDIIKNGLFPLIDFLFKEEASNPILSFFEFNNVTYHCPAKNMEYSSYIEFAMASTLFQEIDHNNADINSYNEIIATLCRPHTKEDITSDTFNGDIREKYNAYHVAQTAKKFNRLASWVKIAVVRFYMSFEKNIRKDEMYGVMFQRAVIKKDGQTIASDEVERVPDLPAWIGFLYDMAGDKFGDFEKTAHTNMHTILIYLCRLRNRKQI